MLYRKISSYGGMVHILSEEPDSKLEKYIIDDYNNYISQYKILPSCMNLCMIRITGNTADAFYVNTDQPYLKNKFTRPVCIKTYTLNDNGTISSTIFTHHQIGDKKLQDSGFDVSFINRPTPLEISLQQEKTTEKDKK